MEKHLDKAEIANLVESSVVRNARRDITGALLFTGTYFAQIIEGEADIVDSLVRTISADQRHDKLTILDRRPIMARSFGRWNMVYSGPSRFVERHVSRLLDQPIDGDQQRRARWLAELLHEFAKEPSSGDLRYEPPVDLPAGSEPPFK